MPGRRVAELASDRTVLWLSWARLRLRWQGSVPEVEYATVTKRRVSLYLMTMVDFW